MDDFKKILKQYWGYDDFRGIQREIIESIGAGHDTLGLMPTGGGKSITFQVPALAQEGVCIVITPLIALMKDQVQNLRSRGIKASAIYSGLSHDQIVVTLENAIFGGVMAGIGFGIIFRANANTGGLDVLGAVAKKFYSLDMGTCIFVMNFVIVMASAWMFNIDEALYTLVSIYVTAELTNRVAAGLNREKSIFIVSPAAQQICQDIMENVHRGVTYLEGKGGFAREHKDILFIVVRLTQVSRVKAIVDHYDSQAFMIVSDTSEVSGKGFTLECESYQDARAKWLEEQERQREIASGQF